MTELQRKILATLEERNLAPRPAYVFLAKFSVFWILATSSIILGGISFAILLFAISGYRTTGWSGFDNVPLEELLFSIPALWVVTTPLFMASAAYSLRHTRRGYRIPARTMVALSLATSLALGLVLHVFDMGRHVHELLEKNVPYYERLTHIPFAEWSRPQQGYLGGRADRLQDSSHLLLTDFHGKQWIVDISSAKIELVNSIVQEGDVAIRGNETGSNTFLAVTISEFD